jgi:hypothetical protein
MLSSQHRGRLLIAACAAIGLLFSLTGPTAAGAVGRTPTQAFGGAGTFHYRAAPLGAQVYVRQGIKGAAGQCLFSYFYTGSGNEAVNIDELAFDPSNCTDQLALTRGAFATHRAPSAAPVTGGGGALSGGQSPPLAAAGTDSRCTHPTNTYASTGSFRHVYCWDTWTQEPAQQDVGGVTTEVQYTPGNCAGTYGYFYSYQWEELAITGWGNYHNTWKPYASCGYIQTSVTEYFANQIFCILIPTYVSYTNQTITGYTDGHYTIADSYSKSGGCSGLLGYSSSNG